jgi:hypothetical protein
VRELSPFRVEFTNFIAVIAQYCILLIFMAALIIETDSLDVLNLSDLFVGIFLISINAVVLVCVLVGALLR